MTLRFPGIGRFAYIEGSWWRAVSSPPSEEHLVRVIVEDRRTFQEFQPRGEVERNWKGAHGAVSVLLSSVDEIVYVSRLGRYQGEPVRRLGKVVNGAITVGLESESPGTAARLGFSGDGRIETFNKRIDPAEFTDVSEEVTVMYRRDDGGGVDG